jgi:hypothetical protein
MNYCCYTVDVGTPVRAHGIGILVHIQVMPMKIDEPMKDVFESGKSYWKPT